MDARETLERRIDELCRENEQLRQQVASLTDRSFRTADKMDCLETENEKLRLLVRDVVLLAGVNGCDVTNMQLHVDGGDWRTIAARMRELGILEEA